MLDSQSNVLFKLYLQYNCPRMIEGLMDKMRSGNIWRNISVFSRVKEGLMLDVWYVNFPRCVEINIYNE